MSIEEKSKFQK